MLDDKQTKSKTATLLTYDWPPVPSHQGLDAEFQRFLGSSLEDQKRSMHSLRGKPEYDRVLNEFLGIVSAYLFSYRDSPLYLATDDDFEIALQRCKIVLEREVLDHWLPVAPLERELTQAQAADHLERLITDNPGVVHPLFDFLEHQASAEAFQVFLRNEVCRNEVVDDEVAVMTTGIQGAMKLAVCSNLWDEVGKGHFSKFHTYWLRRLVDAFDDWEALLKYRNHEKPWFTMITTNVFNILLSRPGLKFRRYGWFLLNEAWVAAHFQKIIAGMNRLGWGDAEDIKVYFTAHLAIDPRHTRELSQAFRDQVPELAPAEVAEVLRGAYMSLAASTLQYDRMLGYLRQITDHTLSVRTLQAARR